MTISSSFAASPSKFKAFPRGFTMIEFLIVIAILATLAVLLVPAVSNSVRESRIEQARATIKTMGDAYYRTFLLEEFDRIPEESAGTVFVPANPGGDLDLAKQQVENAAEFYFDQGLVSKIPDTRYVLVLGGEFVLDEAALGID